MFDTLKRLTELSERCDLSRYALAKRTGISYSTIQNWYANNLCPPLDKLEPICLELGVTLAEFFSDEGTLTASEGNREMFRLWDRLTDLERSSLLMLSRNMLKGRGQLF